MKRLIACFLALTLLGTISACSSGASKKEASDPQPEEAPIDFEAVLRQEAFPETDELHDILNDVVVFENFSVEETTVHFQLHAPYIYEQLVAWYEAQEDFDEVLLTGKIRELLNGEKQTVEISLEYQIQNETVMYAYTNEYLSAIGCGIREFYAYLYTKLIGGSNDG